MDEFREWLSDNLRYIALILGVLIVLGGAFLGVRAVTKTGSAPKTESATDSVDDSTGGLVTSGSAKPSGTVGSVKDASALVTEDGQLTEEAQNGIKAVVKSYYDALNARNVDAVKKVTDTLSAEDITTIEKSQTAYSGVSVIPKVGPTGDGRNAVAFVDYKYQNPDQAILHSGLSWLYLQYNESESAYKITVDAADDTNVQTYVQSLTADPEISSVMQRVQVEADAAAAADMGVSQGAAEPAAENSQAEETATEEAVTEDQTEAAEGQPEAETSDGQSEADAAAAQAQAAAAAVAAREQAEAAAQAQAQAEAVAAQTRESGDAAAQAQADAAAEAAAAQAQAAADAAAEAQAQAQAGARAGDTAVILETCNVRKGAGYDYEVVTVAEEGSSVTILDDEGQGWVHVQTENGNGYIGRKFIYGETN